MGEFTGPRFRVADSRCLIQICLFLDVILGTCFRGDNSLAFTAAAPNSGSISTGFFREYFRLRRDLLYETYSA